MTTFRSYPITRHPNYTIKRAIFLGILLAALALIILQLANLSLRQSARFSALAKDNILSHSRLAAPRGNIFDINGNIIVTNRKTHTLSFSPTGMRDVLAQEVLTKIQSHLGTPSQDEIDTILATSPRWTRHILFRLATQEQILPFVEHPEDYPGLRIAIDYTREYHHPTALALITGYLGRIQPGETETFARPRYLPDDEVGRAGLERALEHELAGFAGRERLRRDARRRLLTEPELLSPGIPGKDLVLTLDAALQETAMAELAGLKGTLLIMNARTGAIRVMASSPTFDASNLAVGELDGQPVSFFNRAMRGTFPPASTFKIVGAAVAQTEGIDPTYSIACAGSFRPPGWDRAFWCNVRTGHGPQNLAESLQHSCNVYYYRLAELVDPAAYIAMARGFGFGSPTGIDLPGEAAGRLPDLQASNAGERTNFSIGQGSMLATPLQVVRAYAALANGGDLVVPRVLESLGHERRPGQSAGRLALNSQQIAAIHRGLWLVVNQRTGTAFRAEFPAEWDVAGKTGTAENPSGGTDAWMAGYYSLGGDPWAFVVHLEEINEGGGDAAAPTARRLIAAHHGAVALAGIR